MTTKWKSEIFSNETKNKNKNIDVHKMQNRIKNIKKDPDNIEPFETIDVDDDNNLKEGMFNKDDFTGYSYPDPDFVGASNLAINSITESIDKIYDYVVSLITYIATEIVNTLSSNEDDKDEKGEKEEDIKTVRKYVSLFFCLFFGYFAVFNLYYLTTFKNPLTNSENQMSKILKNGLTEKIKEMSNGKGLSGNFWAIILFLFEFVFIIFDDLNKLLIDQMPTVISSLSNKLITFLILYVLAVIIFYYFAETMKDLLNTLFSGELLNFTGKSNNDDGFKYFAKLLMLVIAFYIGKSIGKDKKEGFFNDHYFASVSSLGRLASNGVPGIPMIGLWIIVNILRFIMLMMITCTVLPILWAFAIIFFCFLIIPIDSGFNIAEIMSKFDDIINDCLTDFKQDKRSDCDENMSIVQTIIFILKVIFHFIFKNLLPISYISIFVIAICDYIYNINNIGLKNMLIGATTGIIFVALFILSNSGFESIRENLMQANLKSNFFKVNETDLFKKYEFDISKIPSGDKALEKINKDIAELNQTRTKDIKEIVKPIFSNNKD